MKTRKPRERDHCLYISFTIDTDGMPMCIFRDSEKFRTQKLWASSLRVIAKHYKKTAYDVLGIDGLCDFPETQSDEYYKKEYTRILPTLVKAFETGEGFPSFDLWEFNEEKQIPILKQKRYERF